ncbi:hypothetical protein L1987_85175 [Smallanthus sonchifolius]|uniref:Uncharacterized protein n=1 Tax=Smallanthus sonchifolius TaxID=185202 RepID=A0ACB8XVT5_9ASTR|nr:hypothetical protein L1987_85175 [Smallanthus sonchifolius]
MYNPKTKDELELGNWNGKIRTEAKGVWGRDFVFRTTWNCPPHSYRTPNPFLCLRNSTLVFFTGKLEPSAGKMSGSEPKIAPLMQELTNKMKNPLDMIRRLQDMGIFGENPSNPKSYKPSLPNIVVLGESSAGNGVISKLVGLILPSELKFPVIFKYTTESDFPTGKISLEFHSKKSHVEKEVSESELEKEILQAVPDDTFTVIHPRAHVDLNLIILPGIGIHDQKMQMSLYEGYISRYTKYNECLFLNVLACSSDPNHCLSRKILDALDYYGTRTVTVFTKLHFLSDYLVTYLTSTKFETRRPFGFFCVEDDEDTQKGVKQQSVLLSKVDRNCIGFKAISKNIVIGLLAILFSPDSQILKRVNCDLAKSELELNRCQKTFNSVRDAIPVIETIINTSTTSIRKLFVTQEYEDYINEPQMHVATQIACQFRKFRNNMLDLKFSTKRPFLMDEIWLLNALNWPNQTNFAPCINKQLLDYQFSDATVTIDGFVANMTHYLEKVVVRVIIDNAKEYEQLHQIVKKMGRLLVGGVKEKFRKKIEEMVTLEKGFVYTSSEEYNSKIDEMKKVKFELDDKEYATIEGVGHNIKVDHLKVSHLCQVEAAFELKKLMIVYWEYVVKRFVDYCALNLQSVINETMTWGIEKLTAFQRPMEGIQRSRGPNEDDYRYSSVGLVKVMTNADDRGGRKMGRPLSHSPEKREGANQRAKVNMVKEKQKPPVEVPPPSDNRNWVKSQVAGVKRGEGRTFSEVLCNARGSSVVVSNDHQEILVHVPDETRAFQELYGKALVGRCVDVVTLTKLNSILNDVGFRYESLSYIGGLSTLIKFDSEELGSDLLNNHEAWASWFTSLEEWQGQEFKFERIAWEQEDEQVREDVTQVAALEVGMGSSEINNGGPIPHVDLVNQPQSVKEKGALLDNGNELNLEAPPLQFPFESQGSCIRPIKRPVILKPKKTPAVSSVGSPLISSRPKKRSRPNPEDPFDLNRFLGSGIFGPYLVATVLEEGEIRDDGCIPRDLDLNAVASSGDPGDPPSRVPSIEGMAVDPPLENDELELSATVRMGNMVGARLDNFLDLVKISIDGEACGGLEMTADVELDTNVRIEPTNQDESDDAFSSYSVIKDLNIQEKSKVDQVTPESEHVEAVAIELMAPCHKRQ